MPWHELDGELDLWLNAGLVASMWVRDDDAQTASPALERLTDTCGEVDVPLALAVIPSGADESLAKLVGRSPQTQVLQHGWSHTNHAGPEEKKTELGDHRPFPVVFGELREGREKLEHLFAGDFVPAVAPPWNRIGQEVAGRLAAQGYAGLSTFGSRARTGSAPGLVQVNTHVDIIDWRGTRGYRGDVDVVAQALAHLRARRLGETDRDEATGLITHHLVHDDGCWRFISDFLQRYANHAAVRWPPASAIFAPQTVSG